jgi:hypothetical protein
MMGEKRINQYAYSTAAPSNAPNHHGAISPRLLIDPIIKLFLTVNSNSSNSNSNRDVHTHQEDWPQLEGHIAQIHLRLLIKM